MDTDNTEYEAWCNDQQHQLKCRIELSALYHGKRERFLLVCERVTQATAALTATAAFSQLVGVGDAAKWLGLVAAGASIAPLVFAWSSRANKHAVLGGDHRRLLAQMAAAGDTLEDTQITAFKARLLDIEADERAALGALVVQCQNEMAVAQGHPEHVKPLTFWQRMTMHVWDWDFPSTPTTQC
jgi:hypothetical protein